MKRILYILVTLALVITIGTVTIGCSSGPSAKAAHDAIMQYIESKRSEWDSSSNSFLYRKIEDVKVQQIGKPVEIQILWSKGPYYPVKVKLIDWDGTAFMEREFVITQDSYGEWVTVW